MRLGRRLRVRRGRGCLQVGAYVAYYGWYEIRALRNPATTDPVIDTAASVQRAVADSLDAAGPATVAVLFVLLLLTALLIRRRRRSSGSGATRRGSG
ncbi:hypothetical protein [Streptomyces sp. 11x1]|uniref:hypothetical protein n=1 Tax=Streptomyces sp. 11x1 TaxID=3038642 RepID=UPI00292E0BD0|nr:hypothetical protein [Streptomyces sp. 11x1]WNZ09865.1 hypothetical protein P8T65_21185 [Streptomyces sp. 11x1]